MNTKKLLAAILAVAMVIGMISFPAFAETCADGEHDYQLVNDSYWCVKKCSKCDATDYNTRHRSEWSAWTDEEDGSRSKTCTVEGCENKKICSEHTGSGRWVAGEDGETCEQKCSTCAKVIESHSTTWGEWEAPRTGSNTSSNYCYRTCTTDGCGRREGHPIQGDWGEGENQYTLTCETCGAVQTCDHTCGWGPWRIDGENCVHKCQICSLTESHASQWGEYVEADTTVKPKRYCAGRYCTVEGCHQVNRINTVEELQAAIDAGLKTIQPDAWEPWFYEPHDMQIQNSPITVTENATIDGGEEGVTIQRLGYGYAATKTPTFIVENGATLTLKNLTISGGGGDMNGDFMIIVSDGTVILDDGVVLMNGGTYKSGTVIQLDGGDLVMNDGSKIIDNIYGGSSAVVINKGTFTMNGGEISGNKVAPVTIDGSRYNSPNEPESAKFIMNGGSISNNDGPNFSAGVVTAPCGTVVINGGKITNNAGGGLSMGEGSLEMNGGEISGNSGLIGAGIVTESALSGILGGETEGTTSVTISGGVIKDNRVEGELAGILPSADVILGFTDAEITGGEIGTFVGNEELLESGLVSDLTEEQLAKKPVISGGTFESDVKEYVAADNAEISYAKDGKTTYAVGEASTAALLEDAGEGAAVTVVTGTEVKGVPDGVTVTNGTENPVSVNGGPVVAPGESATAREYKVISVVFEDVTAADAEGEKLYNINLVASDDKIINRLNAADLTFALEQLEGKTGYQIIASGSEVSVNPVENSANRYEFHYNGKDDVADTANTITIGQVKFEGYGRFHFAVDAAAETNVVHTTKTADNLVDTFVPDGDTTALLAIDSAKLENVEIAAPKQTLTVNIAFNNAIEDNAAAYQQMKATISGGDLSENIVVDFGNDNAEKVTFENGAYQFVIENELTRNTAYTVTIEGAGYRTARYTVNMTGDKTLNFWNNVKDEAVSIEEGAKEVTKNFLAGDIVKDNNINIYDLSAVVSYFGEDNLVATKPGYAKYDLNRDGKIDSKDVAYVLVSWGE